MALHHPVLAVTGLRVEARIAAGAGIATIAGGGDAARLALLLGAALARGARGVISFGIAGGLRPGLRPGQAIVGRAIDDGERRFEADPDWTARLASALPDAVLADLAGVDRAVCGIDPKRILQAATGAAAVDMESHVAARLAARYGVPFAALRIVADPHDRTVPDSAMVGMRPDGTTDVRAVLRALGRQPSDLPGLIRTALDARSAFAALGRNRRALGPLLGFDEPGARPDRTPGLPPGGAADLRFRVLHAAAPEGPAKRG